MPAEDTDVREDPIREEEVEARRGQGDFSRIWDRLVSSEADPEEDRADLAGSDTVPPGHLRGHRED